MTSSNEFEKSDPTQVKPIDIDELLPSDSPPSLPAQADEESGPTEGEEEDALSSFTEAGVLPVELPVEFITGVAGCLAAETTIGINRGGKSYNGSIAYLVSRLNGSKGETNGRGFDSKIPTKLRSVNSNGIVVLHTVLSGVYSGKKLTYLLETESGHSLRATEDHQFMTPSGWSKLADLRIGKPVLVDRGKGLSGRGKKAHYVYETRMDYHPFRSITHNRGRAYYRVPKHRLIMEALINGVPYSIFLEDVRAGRVSDYQFLNPREVEVHHADENTLNNTPDNLVAMTVKEHREHHAATYWTNVQAWVEPSPILRLLTYGEEDTFDLTMASGLPNFLANGIVVHNSGKTFLVKKRIEDDPFYGLLTSSTGVAAVNLGGTTLNSALKFFDTASLAENYERGKLQATLAKISRTGVKNLVLDEVSMTAAPQIDIICSALEEVNRRSTTEHPLGFVTVGDPLQLPPVKAEWFFKAQAWAKFQKNTTKLTKIWRQSDPAFLNALNFLRSGNGAEAAEILKDIVTFAPVVNKSWDGTTIVGKNDQVDRHNYLRLMQVTGQLYNIDSARWGKQATEWARHIPAQLQIKVGALVVILTNDSPEFTYANGDTGHVRGFEPGYVLVELKRNGEVVKIGKIHRTVTTREEPPELAGMDPMDLPEASSGNAPFGKISFDPDREVWHVGGIRFMPLRLAYASTVHRSQGLSLDSVQVDLRDTFTGMPAMVYVSLSRVKTPQGLRIVGTPDLIIKRCNVDAEVIPFI
jgi:ATP-dependent DNA helicase PIF1